MKDEDGEEEDSKKTIILQCPNCKTIVNERCLRCRICGVSFDEEEIFKTTEHKKEIAKNEKLLKEEGIREKDSNGATILLCPNCRTIVEEKCKQCHICGAIFSETT